MLKGRIFLELFLRTCFRPLHFANTSAANLLADPDSGRNYFLEVIFYLEAIQKVAQRLKKFSVRKLKLLDSFYSKMAWKFSEGVFLISCSLLFF